MKFIRKHTEGPWENRIMAKSASNSITISECGGGVAVYCDALLISQAPAMLDYLIERAEYIHKILVYNYGYPKETEPTMIEAQTIIGTWALKNTALVNSNFICR